MMTLAAFLLSASGCATAGMGIYLFLKGYPFLGSAIAFVGAATAINFAIAARNFAMVGG